MARSTKKMVVSSDGDDEEGRYRAGVQVFVMSVTGANAEITSVKGAVTSFISFASFFHVIFMDMLSLPTGMLIPNSGQS